MIMADDYDTETKITISTRCSWHGVR
jgi:hypothetical protein